MSKMFHIAAREFLETVRTKIFLINLLLTPLLIVGTLAFARHIQGKVHTGPRPERHLAVVDRSNHLADKLQAAIESHNAEQPHRKISVVFPAEVSSDTLEELKERVRAGTWDALLVIAPDALDEGSPAEYYADIRKIEDMELMAQIRSLLARAVTRARLARFDIPREVIAQLDKGVPFVERGVGAASRMPPIARLITPFFFLFLMFMGVMGSSQGMLTSVIEEKNSRVVEVLLSAVSPFQLMAGKILGLAAVGLAVLGLWSGAAYGAAAARGIAYVFHTGASAYFLLFFLLGFVLLSSVFAAVGAACNTLKEAQSFMTPVMLCLVIPMVAWFYIVQYPSGLLAVCLSFFPLTAPMVMILRLAAVPAPPVWQVIGSLAVLCVSAPAAMWAAAKIFRVGVLMYGKPPSPRELLRWIWRS